MMINNVTKGQVFGYLFLPRIFPRLNDLVFSGFSFVALFLAQIYYATGLLPSGHPYLNSANMGRFGIRHVIAEAASHLVFKKEHIDQILIFGFLLFGMELLFVQLAALGVALFMQTAHAAGIPLDGVTNFTDFFVTPDPKNDLAFILLDRVFGIPDFFGSCVNYGSCDYGGSFAVGDGGGQPDSIALPFHQAMHAMLAIYSMGLLVIAAIILLYFIFAVVAETAETGTPFGKRFNHLWAPLRLVAAFGLLIPIGSSGLNSGQYVTLYAAKWGSSFATNGWSYFLENAGITSESSETLTGETENMVVTPTHPDINSLVEFFTLVQTCKYADEFSDDYNGLPVKAYFVKGPGLGDNNEVMEMVDGTTYAEALDFYDDGDIMIRFGKHDPEADATKNKYSKYAGNVEPTCGETRLTTMSLDETPNFEWKTDCYATETGSTCLQRKYYELMFDMWDDPSFDSWGCAFAVKYSHPKFYDTDTPDAAMARECGAFLPSHDDLKTDGIDWYREDIGDAVSEATEHQKDDERWRFYLEHLGWAGAGIWYNTISQINGELIGAAFNLPYISRYPLVMQEVFNGRQENDVNLTADWYTSFMSGQKLLRLQKDSQTSQMRALFEAKDVWKNITASNNGGGVLVETIQALFGLEGLYNILDNDAEKVHPLAQLSAIGRSLIESAIRNLGFAGVAMLGGAAAIFGGLGGVGETISGFANFFMTIATLGLSIGFVLFYIIPLMPFLYFFFAVGKWVKSILEAMIGVPLWALAHLRIDGNGLPGDAAMSGYWLIFEIFLRPILVLFGFLASTLIFSSQVKVLHEIWDMVTVNVAGYNPEDISSDVFSREYYRGVVDQFFYTLIYAIIVYMLANASFKLVDLIPNNMLRWMGQSVSTFGEQVQEDTNIVRNAFMASGNIMDNLKSGVQQGGQGLIKAGQGLVGSNKKQE